MRRLYLGRLQMQRRQERREIAQSAGAVYALAREGRLDEIDPADSRRLHKAGQMEGVLEAAQYGRSAQAPGDPLFKERYLAMGEEERARFKPAELARKLAPQDFLELMQGASDGIDETQRTRMEGFVQAVTPMLRSVTVGDSATPQELERDRRLLALIHDEVSVLVADEEKKIGRPLTSTEYQAMMRRTADLALLHSVGLEGGDSDGAIPDAPAWAAGLNDGSGMPSATPAGFNVAALDETDASSESEPQAYPTNATQTVDPDSEDGDGGSEPRTLLAQGPGRPGGGGNRGRGGGPFGRSGAPDLEKILRRREDRIRQLEPSNPKLPSIRDPNIPPSRQHLDSLELELNAAAFRFSNTMAFGHGYKKHAHEFSYPITRSDYAWITQRVLTDRETRTRQLAPRTFVYHNRSENVVVVVDHNSPDGGSMYPVPPGRDGVRYFERMRKENLRK